MVAEITTQEPVRLLSVAETARLLGIAHRTAQKLIASGEIRSGLLGGRRLVSRAEVESIEATMREGRA